MNYFFDKIFPPIVGTFLGACLAFAVKWLQDWREEKKKRVASANYALFVLMHQLNDLVNTESAMSPWLKEDLVETRWLGMLPILGFTENLPLRAEDISWLLGTEHRNQVGRYMSARNGYVTVQGLIPHRNELKELLNDHLEKESLKAGLDQNAELIPPGFLITHISARQRVRLTDVTEGLIQSNGRAIREHYEVLDGLHKAFKSIYPHDTFIRLDPNDDPLKRLGLTLREADPPDAPLSQPRVHRTEVN